MLRIQAKPRSDNQHQSCLPPRLKVLSDVLWQVQHSFKLLVDPNAADEALASKLIGEAHAQLGEIYLDRAKEHLPPGVPQPPASSAQVHEGRQRKHRAESAAANSGKRCIGVRTTWTKSKDHSMTQVPVSQVPRFALAPAAFLLQGSADFENFEPSPSIVTFLTLISITAELMDAATQRSRPRNGTIQASSKVLPRLGRPWADRMKSATEYVLGTLTTSEPLIVKERCLDLLQRCVKLACDRPDLERRQLVLPGYGTAEGTLFAWFLEGLAVESVAPSFTRAAFEAAARNKFSSHRNNAPSYQSPALPAAGALIEEQGGEKQSHRPNRTSRDDIKSRPPALSKNVRPPPRAKRILLTAEQAAEPDESSSD